ncbi:zinc finger, CCHC-type containing protein [Tanacetum coccineum]
MGDKNPIRTLGDYSKRSHEGYRNTIELPVGNNVLQVQIFYDRIDHTLKWTVDYAAEGRLRNISAEKAWATIEELARYKDEGWNDLATPGEGSLNSEKPDIEQLLGVMKCKVDTLMKEAISLMGRRESIFGMTSNIVYQLPSEQSRQEEFENLVMNFILDQEEKVKQLEEYVGVIGIDFMQLSLEVVRKLKEEIRIEQNKTKKIKKITRQGKSQLDAVGAVLGQKDGKHFHPIYFASKTLNSAQQNYTVT